MLAEMLWKCMRSRIGFGVNHFSKSQGLVIHPCEATQRSPRFMLRFNITRYRQIKRPMRAKMRILRFHKPQRDAASPITFISFR